MKNTTPKHCVTLAKRNGEGECIHQYTSSARFSKNNTIQSGVGGDFSRASGSVINLRQQ